MMTDHNISVSSRTDYTDLCRDMGITYYSSVTEMCNQSLDVLLISVSIPAFYKVLRHTVSICDLSNILVVDVLSVKNYAKTTMLELLPDNCDILATHPMFGPESCPSNCWAGFNLVYDRVRITDEVRYTRFMDILSDANLIQLDCIEHDSLAAKSQFITHLIGKLLNGLEITSTGIDTKSYQLLLQIKKIVGDDSDDLFRGLYNYNIFSCEQLNLLTSTINDINNNLKMENAIH